VATPKLAGYEKPSASISPYNAGLKLSPTQQIELEKNLRNRKMLENVQSGLGAAEVLGAFPHPITEGLGFGAGLLNAGLSSYLAGEDYSAGNYGGMAGNLLGAGLSGAGAAVLAPKKVTDVVNTAAKSKNLKELGAYALAGVPPEKAVSRIGKGDLKAMRQVQEVQRKTPAEYEKYLQAALDEDIPDIHFEKAFGKTKSEAQDLIKDRAVQRAAYEQQVAQRQAQEAQRLEDLRAANAGNVQTQAVEDIDVNDIDWSQFDESNDSMYDYVSDDPVNDLDIDNAANQLPPPPETIYTDTSSRDFNFDIAPYRAPDGYLEDAAGVFRNQYGETVAEESARLDQQYADYLADEQGYGSPSVASQLAGGQFRDAKNQFGEVVQEVAGNPNAAMREVKEAVTNSTGENKLKNKALEMLQDYPYYGGDNVHFTNPSEFLSNIGSKKGFAERVNRGVSSAEQIPSGQVFTGSTNTSHNSYLPQLKKIFKEGVQEGDPTFLGYKRMNDSGYLSKGSYSPEEIAAYLNTEIDEQIKRKIVPKNIQRPYVKNDDVLLPHYGITKKENGGWLQKYDDGGPIQPNYNDYSVSAGPGFEGDGYSNVGRNYSPAWGGQFAMGGSLPGSVGFMYARTNDPAPSEGPYAKKTMPSAQDGKLLDKVGARDKSKANKKVDKPVVKDTDRGAGQILRELITPGIQRSDAPAAIRAAEPDDSYLSKAWQTLTHPIEAAKQYLQSGRLPNNFGAAAPTVGLDAGLDAVGLNPLGYYDLGVQGAKSMYNVISGEGGVKDALSLPLNALGLYAGRNTISKLADDVASKLPKDAINKVGKKVKDVYQNTRANISTATNNANIQDAVQDYTHIADMRARRQALVDRIGAQQTPTAAPSVPPATPTENIFKQKGLNFLQNPIDPSTGNIVNESFIHPTDQYVKMVGNSGSGEMNLNIFDNPANLPAGQQMGSLRAEIRHPGTPGYPSSWPQEMPAFTDFNFFNEGPSAAKQLQILMQGIDGKPVYLPSHGNVSIHSSPLMTTNLARYIGQKNAEGIARARVMPTLDYAGRNQMTSLNRILKGGNSAEQFTSEKAVKQIKEQFPKIQRSIENLNNADPRLNLPQAQMMYKNQPIDLSHFDQNGFQDAMDYRNNFQMLHPQYSAIKRWREGGELTKLDQLTNFTNYNTKQPGGWLDKYQ
jgi:hypothetical protein